jgi:hypothetical protein
MNIATLSEYSKHKDGTYASLLCDMTTKQLLDVFTSNNLGLDEKIDPATYHCTLCYSRTPVPDAERLHIEKPIIAYAKAYEVFPTKTGEKCLVIRLHCPQATAINEKLTKMGATSDYASYKPHLTICYNYTGPDDVTNLPLPQFPIVFDDSEVKPLEVDYIPPNK